MGPYVIGTGFFTWQYQNETNRVRKPCPISKAKRTVSMQFFAIRPKANQIVISYEKIDKMNMKAKK
jgi:hypothetical protein